MQARSRLRIVREPSRAADRKPVSITGRRLSDILPGGQERRHPDRGNTGRCRGGRPLPIGGESAMTTWIA